jgi:hypothetical protein
MKVERFPRNLPSVIVQCPPNKPDATEFSQQRLILYLHDDSQHDLVVVIECTQAMCLIQSDPLLIQKRSYTEASSFTNLIVVRRFSDGC